MLQSTIYPTHLMHTARQDAQWRCHTRRKVGYTLRHTKGEAKATTTPTTRQSRRHNPKGEADGVTATCPRVTLSQAHLSLRRELNAHWRSQHLRHGRQLLRHIKLNSLDGLQPGQTVQLEILQNRTCGVHWAPQKSQYPSMPPDCGHNRWPAGQTSGKEGPW